MLDTAIKLKDVINRDVVADEAGHVVDYLLACLTHITNARPLFGVLNTATDALEWTAGGADFHDVLKQFDLEGGGSDANSMTLADLFACFEISETEYSVVQDQVQVLSPGAALTLLQPMRGAEGRFLRMVLRRRSEPNDDQVQFSLLDITPFQTSAKRTQDMANELLAELDQTLDSEQAASDLLLSVVDGLDRLFGLKNDAEIAAMAKDLSAKVTRVAERMVAMLQEFEGRFDTSHWQPDDLNPSLRPIIPVHAAPVSEWADFHSVVMTQIDGFPAVQGLDAFSLKQSYDFVQNDVNAMVISPRAGCIFMLNGAAGGQEFSSIEDFVRAIEVEENSTSTAVDFFASLTTKPALGLFSMAGQNVEAWGRPGLYGGWQAMLAPSTGHGVDVRGLFHGLKNLLLHLQVLYVVGTVSDIDQVREGLTDAGQKIRQRLNSLRNIARTGRRAMPMAKETVGQWLESVRHLNIGADAALLVEQSGVDEVTFMASPGVMEDTLEEVVRNAFQHGAGRVTVAAMAHGDHLCINIQDDGRGMTEEKLKQVRHVINSGDYDARLSTREDGTGNGLLAAAIAVSHFVDGRLNINHGPSGQGVEIEISMKLPG